MQMNRVNGVRRECTFKVLSLSDVITTANNLESVCLDESEWSEAASYNIFLMSFLQFLFNCLFQLILCNVFVKSLSFSLVCVFLIDV